MFKKTLRDTRCGIWGVGSIILMLFLPTSYSGQTTPEKDAILTKQDTVISLDLLVTPASPAFVVLGVEPASIERPGSPTDLGITILSSTNNLTVLPRNYALEFTPYWWCDGTRSFSSFKNPVTFLRTLSISVATATREFPSTDSFITSLGLGVRCSPFRGKPNPVYTDSIDNILKAAHSFYLNRFNELEPQDALLKELYGKLKDPQLTEEERKEIQVQIGERRDTIKKEVREEFLVTHDAIIERLNRTVDMMQMNRIGLKIDVAGAFALDFPQGLFENGTFSKFGGWVTAGWECPKVSFLGVLRLLGNSLYTDSTSFDFGGRLIRNVTEDLSVSLEGLGRWYWKLSDDNIHSRLDVIVDYALFKNNALSFTLGKDYGGGLTEGELIVSMNLKQGFGSRRPVQKLKLLD